ncbi:MAG: 3-phosphoshikimate 1-carboxyvinyltransferase [Candidatus Poseidoniaceae archaeon]
MAKGWVKRWGARGKGHRPSHIPAIEVQPTSISNADWVLPPSKSHLIRMMHLCALSPSKHQLTGFSQLGEDAESMRRCLTQLGVRFSDLEHGIEITGIGINGFNRSPSVLHAGNSGTALRLLLGLTSRFPFVSMIDGDSSLRNRNHSTLLDALVPLGVDLSYGVEQERLPILVHGPWQGEEVTVDVSKSSQPYSSLLLASCGLESNCVIHAKGIPVSRRHSGLTIELMEKCGAAIEITEETTIISPWTSNPPSEWNVPSDGSMMSFPILACLLSKQPIRIVNPVDASDALGHETLFEHLSNFGIDYQDLTLRCNGSFDEVDIDLRDANDLLPPLAAILALSGGGRLRGAAHAKHKESNRIRSTKKLLEAFGLTATIEEDGLSIEGGQTLTMPNSLVDTYGDHRIQMTAVLLATQTGATVEGPRLHRIADPEFLTRLSAMPTEVLVKGIQR